MFSSKYTLVVIVEDVASILVWGMYIHRRNIPSSEAWPPISTSNRGETAIAKCPNYPLWLPLSLVAFTVCWIPHSFQGTAQQGAEWGLIKAINPLFSAAFEATFDKLQLISTTLISKMIRTL